MKRASSWDRIGIGISGLCALHCLIVPAAVAILPLWPVAESLHEWTHPVLFVLIVPTVVLAVRKCSCVPRISYLLYSGLAVIGMAWLMHDWLGQWGETLVTLMGSCLLFGGHWINYKHHQQHLHSHHEAA